MTPIFRHFSGRPVLFKFLFGELWLKKQLEGNTFFLRLNSSLVNYDIGISILIIRWPLFKFLFGELWLMSAG